MKRFFHRKNKKGVDIIIGYVLLITIALIMSILVYQWLKTYVPKDSATCPDDTSVFISSIVYNCTNNTLSVTIKNNGKFAIEGYFIHATNKSGEELAAIDISSKITHGGNISSNSIVFDLFSQNALTPDAPTNAKRCVFNVSGYGTLYRLEIIPTRIQEQDNTNKLVSCSNSKVEEELTCIY